MISHTLHHSPFPLVIFIYLFLRDSELIASVAIDHNQLSPMFLYSQGGCFDPIPQRFPSQPPTTTPVAMDPKLPSYPAQFTPTPPAQFPPEMATVGPQGLSFGAPRGAFPGGTMGMGLRPGMTRPQGMGTQLRLPPNQLRLQLQQRLQGPQQVTTWWWSFFDHSVSFFLPFTGYVCHQVAKGTLLMPACLRIALNHF